MLVVIAGFPLFGPLGKTATVGLLRTLFQADLFDFSLNLMLLVSFSPGRDRACCLLDFLFLDPLGKTTDIVFVLFSCGPLF